MTPTKAPALRVASRNANPAGIRMSAVLPTAKSSIFEAAKQVVALQISGGEVTRAKAVLEGLVATVEAQLKQVVSTTPADRKAMASFVNSMGEAATSITTARPKPPSDTEEVHFPIGAFSSREELVAELIKSANAEGNQHPKSSFWETPLLAYPNETIATVMSRADEATANASELAQIVVGLQYKAHKALREAPWA